jgi:hypothetical protein
MTSDRCVFYPLGSGEAMSEGEYQRMFVEQDDREPASALNAPKGRWQTADGALLYIGKMTEEHLKNAIAACKRFGTGRHPKCRELRRELRKRGVRP